MKKILLMLVTVVGLSASMSQEHKDMAGRLVEALGYKCSKVDDARKAYGGKITVYCDGFARKYELKNIGGRWKVEAK